jgi:hypothetical protein
MTILQFDFFLVTIFIEDNHGAATTTLHSLKLFGTTVQGTDVAAIKGTFTSSFLPIHLFIHYYCNIILSTFSFYCSSFPLGLILKMRVNRVTRRQAGRQARSLLLFSLIPSASAGLHRILCFTMIYTNSGSFSAQFFSSFISTYKLKIRYCN